MVIRRVVRADREALFEIHAAAFRRAAGLEPPEVALFAQLDRAGDVLPELSLAAVVDRLIVGHVVGSRATVGPYAVAAVGPIGVPQGLPKSEVIGFASASLFFKTFQIHRAVDPEKNVLVYTVVSTKLINGSPFNSISVVPAGVP